jgi:uncharacterized coiled-coil protein SlyX
MGMKGRTLSGSGLSFNVFSWQELRPLMSRAIRVIPLGLVLALAACAGRPQTAPAPETTHHPPPAAPPETVVVRDRDQDRRIATLELRLLEKDAQIAALTGQLNDARQEVVRAMARLRTLATRAEAASGMAEAELAVQSLKAKADRDAPEPAQAQQLLDLSSNEFNSENYGGALYLATQAKTVARAAESRVAGAQDLAPRPGETLFAIPVPLKLVSRANVRGGPGTSFSVLYTLEAGTQVLGHSYTADWVRVVDDSGRAGWVTRNLVTGR